MPKQMVEGCAQEGRVVVYALSGGGWAEQGLECVLGVEEGGALVCELLADMEDGVGDEDVAFWSRPVRFQEDGLRVSEEVAIDALADFEGHAQDRGADEGVGNDGFAGACD